MRRLGVVLDSLDMLAALLAVPILLALVISGHVPRDLELWGYALAGTALLVGIALAIRARRNR